MASNRVEDGDASTQEQSQDVKTSLQKYAHLILAIFAIVAYIPLGFIALILGGNIFARCHCFVVIAFPQIC